MNILEIIPFLSWSLVFICAVCFFWYLFSRLHRVNKTLDDLINIPTVLPEKGLKVPVWHTYYGFKKITPFYSLWDGEMLARLILFDDHMECRVIFNRKTKYKDIVKVDIFELPLAETAILTFNGKFLALGINFLKKDSLRKFVGFLSDRGVALSEKASDLIKS